MTASSPDRSSATYVMRLTPPGRAAIATILVSGPCAVEAVSRCFRPQNELAVETAAVGRIVYGTWCGTDSRPAGEELVVCRVDAHEWEIHCHGGEAAVRAIIDDLVALQCVEATWPLGAVPQGETQLQQQARLAMSAASTELAALRLLHQYNGALAAELYKTLAAIDDEDLLTAQQLVRELSRREPLGLHLVTPWQIVLAGPPNVGKSSLINALLGYERSLVYDQPGTTRDVVQANTAIRGWPVTLTDTAGLRHAAESLESIGIKHAQQQIAGADLVLNVIDVHTSAEAVTEYQRQWPASILVVNKSDLPRATERVSDLTAAETSRRVIATSTLCGSGIDELMEAIAAVLIGDELPLACALPFLSEHYRVLAETSTLLAAEDSTAAKLMLRSLL
ncbi:MAG: 50S ribosome-binding GTPase [Planctomycetales bacterium]|nr:50S ribosome-binding GTPase [Planctomycetales bacterium]